METDAEMPSRVHLQTNICFQKDTAAHACNVFSLAISSRLQPLRLPVLYIDICLYILWFNVAPWLCMVAFDPLRV